MEKYGFMPGSHEENRSNPPVRSKFDKSQGKGLPAPHLKHPGETAKETGSTYPGHTSNGHKMPTERTHGFGGHTRTHYGPGEMGAPIIRGSGMGESKNSKITDSHLPHMTKHLGMDPFVGHEPDAVHAGVDKHSKQHSTGHTNPKMGGGTDRKVGASRPQKMEDSSRRSKQDHGALAGDAGPRRSYYGGKGRI